MNRLLTHILAGSLLSVAGLSQAEDWVYPLDVSSDGERLILADRNWPGVWSVKNGELSELFAASKKFRTPLNAVRCVAFGPGDEVYAGCSSTRQVYRLGPDGPVKLAGDGVGIGIPMDLAIASDGSLYVSDIELHRIFRLPPEGGEPEEVAVIRAPRGVFWDGDSLLVVSHGENGLIRVQPDGTQEPVVTGQPFNFPHEVARLGDTYFITDGYEDGIWPVSLDGEVGELLKADGLVNPVGITRQGERLITIDPRANSFFEVSVGDDDKAVVRAISVEEASTFASEPAAPATK